MFQGEERSTRCRNPKKVSAEGQAPSHLTRTIQTSTNSLGLTWREGKSSHPPREPQKGEGSKAGTCRDTPEPGRIREAAPGSHTPCVLLSAPIGEINQNISKIFQHSEFGICEVTRAAGPKKCAFSDEDLSHQEASGINVLQTSPGIALGSLPTAHRDIISANPWGPGDPIDEILWMGTRD